MNYFLVASAFLVAAFATGLQADEPIVSIAVGILGILVSLCFHRIEIRTQELVKLGEAAISRIESVMREQTGIGEIAFVDRAEHKSRSFVSYGFVISALHYSTLVFFMFGTLYAIRLAI